MSFTITITEEKPPITATEVTAGALSRTIFTQSVETIDLVAVFKAVNGVTRKRRKSSGKAAQ